MNRKMRAIGIALAATCIASCSSPPTQEIDGVSGALRATWEILQIGAVADLDQSPRPSAQLAVYVTQYLLYRRHVDGALDAAVQHGAFWDDPLSRNESFVILQNLAAALQVDVNDMLDRSISRSEAFDRYMDSLSLLLREANAERERLEQEGDDIASERREQRSIVSDIQRNLNRALREEDYASANEHQQDLIVAEADLATVEARQDEVRSMIRLFEDVIDAGEERAIAMKENRAVILAGLMVVDVPGAEELGVLKQENRRFLRDARSIFDPSPR